MEDFCRTVRKVDAEEALNFILSEKYLRTQASFYTEVFIEHGIDPRKARILEIGSGYGFFLSYARKQLGWNIWGCEPGEEEFSGRDEIATKILNENEVEKERLTRCTGEALVFEDASFDVVISNDVLEHVQIPQEVFKQTARVLKPGGLMVFTIPNYNWIYEGHYNTPWIPGMNKPVARAWVKALGRNPSFVDTLNFLNPKNIGAMLNNVPQLKLLHPLQYGCEDFLPLRLDAYLEAHNNANAGKSISGAFLKFMRSFCTTGLFRYSTSIIASITGMYHEMHVIARKAAH